jgi:hypothetical protein
VGPNSPPPQPPPARVTGPTALVVLPQGTAVVRQMPIEDQPQLAWINQTLGGYFETIGPGTWLALINEDGKRLGLPANQMAHRLAEHMGWHFRQGDVLVGPAVFVSRRGLEIDDCPQRVTELARRFGLLP